MEEAYADLDQVKDNNINLDKFNRTRNMILSEVINLTREKLNNIADHNLEIEKKMMFQNGLSASGIDKIMDNVVEAYSGQISQTNMFTLAGSDFVENVLDSLNK
jgi:hypothetical protein